MAVVYISPFSNGTKQVCRENARLKSAYVSFTSRCWRGKPVGISWKRVSRGENRLSSLGIPFRFLKYTASKYRERGMFPPSRSRMHITRIALSYLPSLFPGGRKKKRGVQLRDIWRALGLTLKPAKIF